MSSSNLLSLASWAFLPNLVTGWVQSIWYGISVRAGDPRPQPGTPRYIQHRRRIHILVVSAYLLYTIYEADWEIRKAYDFYQDLGISHDASEREIKSRFRRLAALHHPDKISSTSSLPENYFVHLKMAQDTLLDPAKRFAYDRFGPVIVEWRHCSSIREYLLAGLLPFFQYYGGGGLMLYILGKLGYLGWGKYWRWLTLISLFVFELYTISRPYSSPLAAKVLNPFLTTFTTHPPYLPFQLLQLLRKIAITMHIAFQQIGPLLVSPQQAHLQGDPEAVVRKQLDRLDKGLQVTDGEVTRLLEMEYKPFTSDPHALKEMQTKMKEWLVKNTIQNDPEVKDALGKLFKRRRVEAPAGARGNR